MSKDERVVSLDERRRAKQGAGGQDDKPAGKPVGKQTGKQGKSAPGAERDSIHADPVPGKLVWLHCPTCGTLEYTEAALSGGRVHNDCGSIVEEAAVALDLRAEFTIATINLERLAILEDLLAGQRQRFEEYQRRLALAAGHNLRPYVLDFQGPDTQGPDTQGPDTQGVVPLALVRIAGQGQDALGLLVSEFFQGASDHFPELAKRLAKEPPHSSPDGEE